MSADISTKTSATDWKARLADREAELLASFNPHVPGMDDSTDQVVLHTDTKRSLTYRWLNISRRVQDFNSRDRGFIVSQVLVTYRTPSGDDLAVGHLNITHTTKEAVAEAFATPFHFADANLGASFGFRWADEPLTDAQIWARAYTNLHRVIDRPASAADKACYGAYGASDAPTDPATLKAEIKIAERYYAKMMRGFVHWLSTPFVDHAHVDGEVEAMTSEHPEHPGNLRGTGVGRMMYLLAAQHLATYNKVLCASGVQSPDAEALWQRLAADPSVPTRKTRRKFYKPTAHPDRAYLCLDYTRA